MFAKPVIDFFVLIGLAFQSFDVQQRIAQYQSERLAIARAAAQSSDLQDYSEAFEQAFERRFPLENANVYLVQADDESIKNLFSASIDRLNYSGTSGTADAEAYLDIVYTEAARRNLVTEFIARSMYDTFISTRRFDDAAAFRASQPYELPEFPAFIESAPPAADKQTMVLRLSGDGKSMTTDVLNLDDFTGVIMVGHPTCKFSQAAISAILHDEKLSSQVEHWVFLADPASSLTDKTIADWNVSVPQARYRIAVEKSSWTEFNYWGTPTFYFYRSGQRQKKVVGWPPGAATERLKELKAGVDLIFQDEAGSD